MQSILADILIVLIGLGILAGLVLIITGLKEPNMPKVKSRSFVSGSELAFWRLLQIASVPLNVAPRVAMAALLEPVDGLDGSEIKALRKVFAHAIVDFVLVDNYGRVKLLVELASPNNRGSADARRDSMIAHAGFKVLRIRHPVSNDVTAIRSCIDDALAGPPASEPRPRSRAMATLSTSAQLP